MLENFFFRASAMMSPEFEGGGASAAERVCCTNDPSPDLRGKERKEGEEEDEENQETRKDNNCEEAGILTACWSS